MSVWTLNDVPWDDFDTAKVDPEILPIVKAAALVEYNGGEYAKYLCNVFPGDVTFQRAAKCWAVEEIQHGQALARWAQMVDPDFDFDSCFHRFLEGFSIDVDAERSIRGSRSGELVARCIVEVGTSSYYTALGDATDEPVLKDICKRIAADELRHYKLFYDHLKRYLEIEKIGRVRRAYVALSRIGESEDDELAYAFYAANAGLKEPYSRKAWTAAYLSRAMGYYRPKHLQRAVAMTLKAAGLKPKDRVTEWLSRRAYGFMQNRRNKMVDIAAA